ncbi:MAG: Ni/Fe-hydrogenase, b-type cytochrome subunit [Gammaproteobacteria bacterium]|nr:Ni/Fe-hydrogenase, b-type cytochrome subunit [Gammaproteobacteria bacterium]
MTSATSTKGGHDPAHQQPIYVYEAPVRIWHWTHGITFFVMCITGYFIGAPMDSVPGEASDQFLMGNIRLIHFIAAYAFTIGVLVRVYWAIVGNHYARELYFLPLWDMTWWRGFFHEIRFYLFMTREMHKYPGHNPLAQTAMFLFNGLGAFFMIATGFALYGEGLGQGSWADVMFGWIIPLIGDSEAVHNWHNLGMWVILSTIIVHMYMAIRADIMSRQTSISTIISGWRMFKDDLP